MSSPSKLSQPHLYNQLQKNIKLSPPTSTNTTMERVSDRILTHLLLWSLIKSRDGLILIYLSLSWFISRI
ncbi:MAG: hypothetical protein RMY28_002945 [Nostoc sp. ChiSLP01]|nr:hypothetical protein [Nostoc sp. CmiSLP01]MDZ8286036.1 hypothetical protein [Nostoc sp. ChiSLP01]